MANPEFEVVIVGAGPAGLSAALWADELGLAALVLESREEAGGQLLLTYNPIENYLGVRVSSGVELRDRFTRSLRSRDIQFRFNSRIVSVNPQDKLVEIVSLVHDITERIKYKYLVFGAGVTRRKLGVPGEREFFGNGILQSGKRDGKKAKGKGAVVIGGGDAAFENALILTQHARHVTLVHRRDVFSARKEFRDKVMGDSRITVMVNSEAVRFAGREKLESVLIRDRISGRETNLDAGAAVVRIGVEPNSGVLRNHVRTNDSGYIEVDSDCRTSIPSIYAVGDVANPKSPTVSTAVGMGTTSVKSIRFGCSS